ncbi:MAG: sulfatase-like hydrolase/transferase [Lentisphaerae bacterium]|nr:sulfatase-like hydrolase/transferase [Lentisphaerota bacterium]
MQSCKPHPNVLIICADEMRADHMACAGNPVVRTPHLDRLARRGTLFQQAHVNNPICMPARATMFTGLLPRDHGVRINGQSLRRDIPVLPDIFRRAGYRTHAAGKLHLTPWVPMVEPPDIQAFPECMDYWTKGIIREFPTPYYGFQSVDFVGGHTAYAYGPYLDWLRQKGGDPRQLQPAAGRPSATGAPLCYTMALPEEFHYNRFIADSTIRLITESAGENTPPFFAWCSFPDPHMPVAPPEPYASLYDPRSVPAPAVREGELDELPPIYRRIRSGAVKPYEVNNAGVTPDQWRELIAGTYGMITHMDAEIGRVLDALEQTGQLENTVIVFTADHGDMMGDHGLLWKAFYTFRGCVRIPLLVAAPGMPGGRAEPALVSQVDLLPSMLDLCGIPLPGSDWVSRKTPFAWGTQQPLRLFPGRSWKPLLNGAAAAIRDAVVIENDDPSTGFRVRSLVTPTHRLTLYPGTEDGELFDRSDDPDELRNLWHRPERAALKQTLIRRLLDAYSLETPLYPIPPWNS